jgi:hypothetical protein
LQFGSPATDPQVDRPTSARGPLLPEPELFAVLQTVVGLLLVLLLGVVVRFPPKEPIP